MHIFFSKYPLFYGMGTAYFKGYAKYFLPNVPWAKFIPGATFIPESRVRKTPCLLETSE